MGPIGRLLDPRAIGIRRRMTFGRLWSAVLWAAAAVLAVRAPGPPATDLAVRWYYLPALALIAAGCLPSLRGSLGRRRVAGTPFLPRPVLVGLTVLVLGGAVVARLWRLMEWPPEGIGFEEYELAWRADVPGGPLDRLVSLYADPIEHTFTAYAISLSFALLGTGFFEMRLPFIVGGVLCPFLLYGLCRRLVSWEPALFAVALFAVSWWQIVGSRPADEILFPLWMELAVLWLLLRFADEAEPWAAFGLALLSGLLIYEYSAYHLVAPMVALYLGLRALRGAVRLGRVTPAAARREDWWAAVRRWAPGTAVLLLVWLVIARLQLFKDIRFGLNSWLLEGVRRHGETGILGRSGEVADRVAFGVERVTNAIRSFYGYHYGGGDRFFLVGDYPAFDPITAATLGLSAVLVLLTPRRRFHVFVLAWTVLIILGAAVLTGNVNTYRYYVALPQFYLLIALGMAVVWDRLRSRAARIGLLGVFAVAAAGAAAINLHRVYWEVVPNEELRSHWIWPRTEIARWVRTRPRDEPVCIVADDADPGITGRNPLRPEWQWMLHGWDVRVGPTVADCLPSTDGGPPPRWIVYALPEPAPQLRAVLARAYAEVEPLAPIRIPGRGIVARPFRTVPPDG